MRFATLLCVLVLASVCVEGCGGLPTTAPSTVPAQAPPQPSDGVISISVGQEVDDTLAGHGDKRVFELTAPSNGTLVARVSFDPGAALLVLGLADQTFWPNNGSIVGTLPVLAGQQYRVLVADGAPWDYDIFSARFVLTTSIE